MLNSSADVNDFIEYYKNIADEIIITLIFSLDLLCHILLICFA